MHSIVTTFREAVIKVEVANFGAAMDTLIDQDVPKVSGVLNRSNINMTKGTSCLDQIQNTARAFQLPKTSSIQETMDIFADN